MPSLERVSAAEAAGSAPHPLEGKTVLIVHPAWHSCGSHTVFVSQAQAYSSLGARVLSLAVADAPGATEGSSRHKAYLAATGDLKADARYFAGMPWQAMARPSFLRAVGPWLHGNFAKMLVETTGLVAIPKPLCELPAIDLIHCNHFFCMPAARRIAKGRGGAIVLDTHDLQARQYSLRNQGGWSLPPVASYDEMLAIELALLGEADALIHLNAEEAATFERLLPGKKHALVYPAVAPVAPGAGGEDLIIVASANYANFLGIVWFLTEVLPLAEGVPLRILGNIDNEVRLRAPSLFRRHAALFCGRVADLEAAYGRAAAVLLPTTSGHGISIKTIEALSSGAPIIATPHAFRGFSEDPASISNVTLAPDAAEFARAMRRAVNSAPVSLQDRMKSDSRRTYEKYFAFEPYCRSLFAVIAPFLEAEVSSRTIT
jgi:glycosyltransferase involved in cell wall biosynthesis